MLPDQYGTFFEHLLNAARLRGDRKQHRITNCPVDRCDETASQEKILKIFHQIAGLP